MTNILDFYKKTLRIRLVEEAIATRYSEQKMRCPTHLSIGQELPPTVISHFLTADDKAYSSHRAHAHYIAKGGCINKLIAELYGKKTGCTGGRGGSMHLTDLATGFIASTAIVGNSIPLAVGNALSQKLQGLHHLTVSYFGEGATEEGAFYESVNFAVLKKLPVLFACENNRYSVYSPLNVRQPDSRKLYELAAAIGTKSFHANGNDLESTLCATTDAIKYIRQGNGPVFIEFDTYRHREHCGPNFDDKLGYRPKKEVEQWISADPITSLESTLLELYNKDDFQTIKNEVILQIESEIKQAFEYAEQSDFGNPEDNWKHLYAN